MMPPDYDPTSLEGHRRFAELHQKAGGGKAYIRAEVEMIPEVDQDVSVFQWRGLVDAWKRKAARGVSQGVDPQSLDLLLERYYLVTDTPTPEYVYSLAALGAGSPEDLQPILEADTVEDLVERVGFTDGGRLDGARLARLAGVRGVLWRAWRRGRLPRPSATAWG